MTIGIKQILVASRAFFLALLLLSLCFGAEAERRDVIVMNNGDRFTGEIKRLQDGLLYIETPYVSGKIGLDWNQVKSIESTATYRIVLNNGQRFVGRLAKDSGAQTETADFLIREATKDEELRVPSSEVASVDSKKPTFWRQLQGSMDLGYSFTSGNNQTALNIDTSAGYRTAKWEIATSHDSTFSGASDASRTNREELQATAARFLSRNSFVIALSDFLHSSQQELRLRTTLGGGYGRYLKRTTSSSLTLVGGVAYTEESFDTTGQPSNQNMEAVVGLKYGLIRFNFGSLDSQLRAYPGLTDSGRFRLMTNNALTIKLRNNFHLTFSFWDNFDSRPPATAKTNELGMSSGIGWSF
jgi:putative salt-induced outer membrane protein YdiY